MRAGNKVLKEVDKNLSLIVVHPRGILEEQLKPLSIHLLNIFVQLDFSLDRVIECQKVQLNTDLLEHARGYLNRK